VNQRGSFSQTPSSQFLFDWGLFWPWTFEFKITNHVSINLWIDWLRRTVKIKLEKLLIWGIELNSFFFIFLFFFSFLLYFNMFLCLVCIYICLFRLVLYFLYIFKHFRLLDLSFQVLFCFSAYLFSGLGFSHVCVRILLYAHAGLKYAYAYNWPADAGLCMHMHTHA